MYSEQIEELIKTIIADGVITKKERSVLHKRAVAEGIDKDEIDVYIEGLIAQMKSDASQSEISKSANVDLNFVTRLVGRDDTIYYHANNSYCVRTPLNGFFERLYLYFFKEIIDDEIRFGLAFVIIYREDKSLTVYPTLLLKTDTIDISIELETVHDLEKLSSLHQINKKKWVFSYFFDEKTLKLLCDAEYVTISITDCKIGWYICSMPEMIFKDISLDGLSTYAKVFYRSIVDKSAYPDALISKTETQDDYLDSSKAIKILYADLKQLKMASSNVSYYKQYIETKTQTIHSFINNGKLFAKKRLKVKEGETDYSFSLGLHALTEKDGVNTYYLELISKYTGESARFFGLNHGILKVSVGLDDYELIPIETDEKVVRIKKKEHCFYMIDSNLLKQLAESKVFDLCCTGYIGNDIFNNNNWKEVSFKNGGIGLKSNLSFSNNWKKAIALLENRDQETSSVEPMLENDIFSWIKKLFGLLKYGNVI